MRLRTFLTLVFATSILGGLSAADHWPQFRGADAGRIADDPALPETWMLSAVAAAFISPGQGPALQAQARVVHQGQRVAVVRTEVTRTDGRRVLEAMSTHLAR